MTPIKESSESLLAQTNYLNKSVEEGEEGEILSERTAVDLAPPKGKRLKTVNTPPPPLDVIESAEVL